MAARRKKILHKIETKLDDKGIQNLVDLAKGRIYSPAGDWFYRLFLGRTVNESRQALQDAWWIEEDDIRQQIYIALWRVKNGDHYNMNNERLVVGYMLRQYLISGGRLFTYTNERFLAAYQYDLQQTATDPPPEEQRSLDIVFEKNHTLSTFERYIMYLSMMLKMTNHEVNKTMLFNATWAQDHKSKLRKKLELMEE